MKKLKKTSIRKQFSLIFIGLMSGTILLCWVVNSLFLVQYYMKSKEQIL